MGWVKRAWETAGVLLLLVFGGFVVLLGVVMYGTSTGDFVLQDARRTTGIAADLAVMLTAIAVWFEYHRKRRKARKDRKKQPDLYTLAADLAMLRARVRKLDGGGSSAAT